MFDERRQQVVADLRRRMDQVGAERVGPALRAEPEEPATSCDESAEVDLDAGSDPRLFLESRSGGGRRAASPASRRLPGVELPPPLGSIFPGGRLPSGAVISLAGGTGRHSLLLALLAAAGQSWSAIVGLPGLGLIAGTELGLDLARVAIIPDPGPDVLQILSVLIDGFDLIAVTCPARIPPARGRILAGKLRQSGAVLLAVGSWPGADLTLRTRLDGWTGLGQGYGRLLDRKITVQVSGRREPSPGRTVPLWFHSHDVDRVEVRTPDTAAAELPVTTPEIQAG